MNNNTVNESVEEVEKNGKIKKRFTNWKLIAAGGGVIALLIGE